MKKWIAMLLCGALSVSALAGCGEKEKYPKEEGATVLKLWVRSFEDWADNLLDKQVREFNSILDDGIQIDLKFYGDDNAYDTAIAAGFENENAPDIFMAQYDRVYTYLKAGYVAPMSDYLTEAELGDFLDSVREDVTYVDPADGKEKMFAYPWLKEPAMMFFYRRDLLEQAGVEKIPTSWAELYDSCSKLAKVMDSKRNQFPLGIPTNAVELTWTTYGIVKNTTGGYAVDDTWTQSRVGTNEEDFKKCAELWYTLAKKGYSAIANLTPEGYTDISDALCEGKIAMCLGGSWTIARFYNYYPEMIDKLGVAEVPTYDGDQSGVTSTNGGWTYVLSGKSGNAKNKLASEFIRWLLCDTENASRYFTAAYNSKAPTTKSLKAYLETNPGEVKPEWVKLVNDVAQKAEPAPRCAWSISNQVGQLFEYMLNHAGENRTFDAMFKEKIKEVKDNIDATISQSGYESNPQIKAG